MSDKSSTGKNLAYAGTGGAITLLLLWLLGRLPMVPQVKAGSLHPRSGDESGADAFLRVVGAGYELRIETATDRTLSSFPSYSAMLAGLLHSLNTHNILSVTIEVGVDYKRHSKSWLRQLADSTLAKDPRSAGLKAHVVGIF